MFGTHLRSLLRVEVRVGRSAYRREIPRKKDIALPYMPAFCDAFDIGAEQVIALAIVI